MTLEQFFQENPRCALGFSGGVDSAYLTALARPARTYTISYAEPKYDESFPARALARSLGVRNRVRRISPGEFWDAVPTVQNHMDEPLADAAAVALYFLNREAAKDVKVVLSGEGADELFGGYPLYRQAVWAERWQKMPRAVRRALAALLPGCGLLHRGALPRWQRSARANYVFETTQERDKYLKRDYCAPTPAQRCKPYFDAVRGLDEPTAVQWVDWQTWLPRDILRKADRMSMAHGLESRVPFLDRELVESVLEEQEDARDEYELAKSAAFAKLGTPHRLDEKEYRRAAGFLMRKGFGSSEIRRALEEYQDSADEES